MTKPVLTVITVLCLLFSNQIKAQVPIAYYDFESNAARNTTIETSIQESITGIGSPSLTATSLTSADGIGNGATYGGGLNTGYALGYYGFTSNASSLATDPNIKLGPFNCAGLSTLTIAMDVQGVGTQAPDNVDIYWSLDDITYTRIVVTTAVANGIWNTRTFTVPAGADGAAALYFKVIGYNGGATATAGDGEMKIDNFTLRSSLLTASKTMISSSAHGTGLSSGGSYIPIYGSLNVNGAAINVTAASNVVFSGTLTLTNGNFVMNNDSLAFQTGNTPIARNGTTQTGNIVMGAASKLVFGRPGNVGGSAFVIPNDVFSSNPLSITALTIQHTNAITLNNQDITLSGNLNLVAGSVNDNGRLITVQGSIAGSGGVHTSTGSGRILMTTSGTINAARFGNLELDNAGGFTMSKAITIQGTLTLTNGTLNVGAFVLTFRTADVPVTRTGGTITTSTTSGLAFGATSNLGGSAFTLPNDLFASAPVISTFSINRTNPITWNNQNLTLSSTLTLTAGILDMGNNTLTLQTTNTPIARNGGTQTGTLSLGSSANLIFGTTGNLGGNAFTIPSNTFTSALSINSLTVQRTNALTWNNQSITLAGNLNLTAGTLNNAGNTISVAGNITGTGTEAGAGTVLMTGSGATISGAIISNLELNNAGGFALSASPIITGTLTLTDGALTVGANTLSFRIGDVPLARTAGTISTISTSNIAFGTTGTGNQAGNAFTIPNDVFTTAPFLNNLTVNRTNSLTLGNQGFTIDGALTLTLGALDVSNNTLTFQNGATPIVRTSGTLTVSTTSNLVFGTTGNTGGAAFAIPASTFTTTPSINNLTVNRTNTLTWNTQALTIDGTLTLTAGALSIGATTLSFQNGAAPIARTAGTLTVATTTNISFGTQAASFTIPDNTFTTAPSITDLTINRAGGVVAGNQSFTIIGTLHLTNGAFDIASNTLTFQTGNTPIATTGGTLTTASASNLIFGTTGNLGGNAFAIPDNTFTSAPSFNSLTVQRTNALTLGNQNISLAGNLNLTAGTLNDAGVTITVAGNITGTGTEAGAGLVLMTGSGGTISGATLSNLQLNNAGGFSLSGSPTIAGTLTLTNGALAVGANTLTFRAADIPLARTAGTITTISTSNLVFGTVGNTGGNAFVIPDNTFTTAPALNSFTVNRTNALTLGNQGLTINGILTLTAGVFDISSTVLTFQNGATPIARTTGTLTVGTTSSLVFGTPGNIGGTAFTIPASTFTTAPSINNLTINRTNSLTLGNQSLTLAGTLTLTAGAFAIASNTLTLQTAAAPIVRTVGTITVTTASNLVFGANAAGFTIPNSTFTAAPSLNNLTVDRAGGITIGNQAFTINGTLALTNGSFDILNTAIIFQTGATPISRTSGTLTVGTTTNITFGSNAGAFTIPDNTFTTAPTITNLTINRTGGITVGNQGFTINGALALTTGEFNILNTTLTFQTGNSPISRTTGTLTVGSSANLVFGTAGNIGGSAFAIPNNTFTTAPSINNFTVNRTNALTLGNQDLILNGTLTLTLGVFNIANNTLTLQNGNIPLARTSGTLTVGATANLVFGTPGNTGGTAFTIPNSFFTATPPSFGSFTINRTNTLTLNTTQGLTLAGDLNLIAGVLDNAGRTISMTAGNITGTGTETGSGIISMTGVDSISGATISNLALNNAAGFTLTGSPTITSTLALTNGALAVGGNALTFHTGNTPITRTAGTITLTSGSSLAFGTNGNTGGSAFTIPANTFTSAPEFTNFSINRTNSLTLNTQNFALTGLLSITAGQLILPTNYIFTLRSTSITNTALVNVVGATGIIGYNSGAAFRVERYIPQTGLGIRAYRDISPSVNTGTRKVFDTWQEGGTNGLVNGVYYGTHVTGVIGANPGGVDAATGMDLTGSGAQSLQSSNISLVTGADAFQPFTTTNQANDTLSALKGYRVLIRGNRLANLYQSPQPTTMNAPAILRSTGTLITGQVTFTTTGTTANGGTNTGVRLNSASATGYTMIGNPYASPVVWDSLVTNATSIQSTYWTFDPNIGTGSYVTYNTLTGCSNIASNTNKYIQPGQAIFVKNTALSPAPVLIFKEVFKAPNTANLTGIYREVPSNFYKINISIRKPVANRGIVTMDGTAVAYSNNFANTIGPEDGNKITNGAENIAVNSNGITLSIEGRKNPVITDTIKLRLWQVTAGVSYQLDINTNDFIDYSYGLKPYLLDRFTNTETELLIKGIKSYAFVTTADTNSYNYRFKIVFRSNYISLPINFTSVKASTYNKGVNVEWSAIENNVVNYQVQRSTDAVNFTTVGTTNAKGNTNSSSQQYLWYDPSPLNTNYYRIQSTDVSGKLVYSNTVLVNIANRKENITVYPNPIKGKTINLQLSNIPHGDYSIMLYSLNGQAVFTGKTSINSTTVSHAIQLPQTLPAGSYMLSIVKDEFSYKQQVIVQ
jgi:hypothetical protein